LDLRSEHAQRLGVLPWDGFAIGGVSVGEDKAWIAPVVEHTAPLLPADKPRYLMGVGKPEDLVMGVAAGVDMFDCVLPSRNARNGQFLTWQGKVNIKGSRHRLSAEPIDADCSCACCRHYTRAYLRHLFVAKELSFFRLATLHNLHFYQQLMQKMRADILAGCFSAKVYLERLGHKVTPAL
jgi:queuine tRNA-ribosyltransferase